MTKFQTACLQLAKSSILEEFGQKLSPFVKGEVGKTGGFSDPEFEKQGACFVTLKKNGELRGCIGSIIPHRLLQEDIKINARNAAFEDPRFPPLKPKELTENLNLGITILSPMEDKTFKNPSDLLSFLNKEHCGLVIKFGYRQATFLPSVREELPTADKFVTHLLWKADIDPKELQLHFSAFEFQIYYGEEFKTDRNEI